MVNFGKRLGKKRAEKRTHPIEIYDALDRKSEAGPLRSVQEYILEEWWNQYQSRKDVVLKLHTGQGKTLIGLLLSLSKINQGLGSALYICPNIYLVEQTCKEAEKFGIPYCKVEGGELPEAFLNAEKILIVHVQKVFNGKSIFLKQRGLNIASIVMDDCHACIESISDAFKIVIESKNQMYSDMLRLFEDDLKAQGEGSFLEIESGEVGALLPVSFWGWQKRSQEVLEILNKTRKLEILNKNKKEKPVTFVWDLIKNCIENCQCYFSGEKLEISTYLSPALRFSFLRSAKHLVAMSATTQRDAFLIKGLGMSSDSISHPLVYPEEKWSGEKMILLPSLINENLTREFVLTFFAKKKLLEYGIVALVSSFKKANEYKLQGATVLDSDNIKFEIELLKSGKFKQTLVAASRYDGIDLPDSACRILVLDSCPYAESLTEKYEEQCRPNSIITMLRIVQKVEQGLGRSVRGEKDYSVILILGDDLVKFMKSSTSKQHLSKQTQKQVDIGLDIVKFSKEEGTSTSPINLLQDLISQCLNRDEDWKGFYIEEMDSIQNDVRQDKDLRLVFEEERYAEEAYLEEGDGDKASEIIQKILDRVVKDQNNEEVGWYLQTMARYLYRTDPTGSMKLQAEAYKQNKALLMPPSGFSYKKLSEVKDDQRNRRIKNWIQEFSSHEELMLDVNNLTSALSFGTKSQKFEDAFDKLGKALGFVSQRPDSDYKVGPDNLWLMPGGHYIIFECKSEVSEDRQDIKKSETGQMNNHCGWFDQTYESYNSVTFVMVIHTKQVSNQGNFTHDVKILRKRGIKVLKDNFKSFYSAFQNYSFSDISDDLIHENLANYSLDSSSIREKYFDSPFPRS
jgi:replicative superfamily II helicase